MEILEPSRHAESGVTLSELLVVVALIGALTAILVSRIDAVSGGLSAGSDELVTISRTARGYALATTTPHRIVPVDATTLAIEYGGPCDDGAATWTRLADHEYELPTGTQLATTGWDICFTTRGWTTTVESVRLVEGASYQDISVLLGGSTRVDPIHRAP